MHYPESSFYFAIKYQQNPDDSIWGKKSPLGKNEVVKLLLKSAQNNSLQERLTNCSVRKTLIPRLLDSDVPVNCAVQPSGHQNVKSRDLYKLACIEHQRTM